jgi:hypothetical protein
MVYINDMKKPLYIIHPGYVASRNDGERHFITFHSLVELYDVPLKYCVCHSSGEFFRGIEGYDPDNVSIISLAPRHDGDYEMIRHILREERDMYEEAHADEI